MVAGVVGYFLAVRFFAVFGVSPSDVGIGPGDMVAPTAAIALVLLAGLGLGWWLRQWLDHRDAGRVLSRWIRSPPGTSARRCRGVLVAVVATATVVGLLSLGPASGSSTVQSLNLIWLMFILVGTGLATYGGDGLGDVARAQGPAKNSRDLRTMLLSGAVLALVLLFGTEPNAERLVNDRGAVSVSPFPMRFGPVTRFVRISSHVQEYKSLERASCALSLGDGPLGRVLLVASQPGERARVVFVNSQLVSIEASDRCEIELPNGRVTKV